LGALCAENEVLLIADEIAVGFGRTGKMFAHQHGGIVPDIVCVGKSLSAGYLPISAAIVREGIFNTFRDRPEDHTLYHGHTFAGNPIAAAAAVETLRVYEEDRIVEGAARLGEILKREFSALAGIAGVGNVRTLGMMGVVELAEGETGAGAAWAARVRDRLREKGVLLRPLGNVVYVMPPLVTPEPVLRELAGLLGTAMRETA
jgi:adenosylmethionine-8-amino-7-oxononanoate aminotransferase